MVTDKKIAHEEEWFRKNERELLEQAQREREQRLRAYQQEHEKAEREKLRLAHWLKCPKCGNDMIAEQMQGIEVDVCTVCEGVYFDHGELETLLMGKQENRFKFYRRIFGLD
jgi:hypothetical protein